MKKKVQMTTLDKQKMLSKLLLKVESKGDGFSAKVFALASKETCITIADKTKRCEKAAAIRFFTYLKQQGYVGATKDGKGRCCIPQEYRENKSDSQTSWLKEVVTCNDPFKDRGRIPGVSPYRKSEEDCSAFELLEMEEVPEEYILNPETGIYEEPVSPDDSIDNYDPETGEWKTLPGEDEVVLLGGKECTEDSVMKLMTDLAPLMLRAKKLGITLSISNN